jgi:hypothetical protein
MSFLRLTRSFRSTYYPMYLFFGTTEDTQEFTNSRQRARDGEWLRRRGSLLSLTRYIVRLNTNDNGGQYQNGCSFDICWRNLRSQLRVYYEMMDEDCTYSTGKARPLLTSSPNVCSQAAAMDYHMYKFSWIRRLSTQRIEQRWTSLDPAARFLFRLLFVYGAFSNIHEVVV